jgi:hypothetical protein
MTKLTVPAAKAVKGTDDLQRQVDCRGKIGWLPGEDRMEVREDVQMTARKVRVISGRFLVLDRLLAER